MLDRLDRLRHHAVVGRDHQNHDIGELCAARTHRTECGMARRVEEADHALVGLDVVRADMLGDAACFAGRDLGAADGIQQRGLAVIDVAHDGDHRRTRRTRAFGFSVLQQRALEIVLDRRRRLVAKFLDREHCGVVIEYLVDGDHHAHLEQRLDYFAALECEFLRQIGHADAFADRDITHHRCGGSFEAVRAVALTRGFDARSRWLALACTAPGAIGIGQMQLAGEAVAVAAVIGHRVRAAHRLFRAVRRFAVFATARFGLGHAARLVGRRTHFLDRCRYRRLDFG